MKDFEDKISAALLGIMTIIAFINVVSRYVFKASLSFTDEITTKLFILLSLLGAGIATKNSAHLGLSVLTDFISKRNQKYVKFSGNICGAIFSVILVYYGIAMTIHEYKLGFETPGMQWPEWIFGAFVPIGGAVLLYRFAQVSINALKEKED